MKSETSKLDTTVARAIKKDVETMAARRRAAEHGADESGRLWSEDAATPATVAEYEAYIGMLAMFGVTLADVDAALAAPPGDISHITEYGLTQRLSAAVRVF